MIRPRVERFETIFGRRSRPEGVAVLAEGFSDAVTEHAYWGGMRDRMPASQRDALHDPAGVEVERDGDRVRVRPRGSVCLIRSGQELDRLRRRTSAPPTWSASSRTCGGAWTSSATRAATSAASPNRYLTLLDEAGRPTEKTYGLGWWRTLADLERLVGVAPDAPGDLRRVHEDGHPRRPDQAAPVPRGLRRRARRAVVRVRRVSRTDRSSRRQKHIISEQFSVGHRIVTGGSSVHADDRDRPPHLARPRPPGARHHRRGGGLDFVGVRVKAVTEGEHQYPMAPGSPMSRETLLRLSDTGLTVRDVEFLQLRPDTGPDDWMPALEAGAALGASTFSVVGVDPDRARLTATLARLTADAAPYGIRPTLEPISYQPVSRVADAAAVARAAGAAVLLDALHIQRGGSSSPTSARWSRRSCRASRSATARSPPRSPSSCPRSCRSA